MKNIIALIGIIGLVTLMSYYSIFTESVRLFIMIFLIIISSTILSKLPENRYKPTKKELLIRGVLLAFMPTTLWVVHSGLNIINGLIIASSIWLLMGTWGFNANSKNEIITYCLSVLYGGYDSHCILSRTIQSP